MLVTGPTGSGKTTTLYAALSRLPRGTLNMMTVEDPIEYALDGVGQTQVNPKIDLDFARALRAILRQDPDIIMIGEIRDLETAQIAVQASLTGHLVLATLHTNDAASAMTRLADMGVEPYLLASSLLGVLAQRLVRTLCTACRTRAAPTAGEAQLLAELGLPTDLPLHAPTGCSECRDTGYRGRSGVYELIVVDDALRRLIHDRAPEHALRRPRRSPGRRRCAAMARAGLRTARPRSPSSCAFRAKRDEGPRSRRCSGRTAATSRVRLRIPLRGRRRARQAEARIGSTPKRARQVRDRLRAEGLFPTAIDAEGAPTRARRPATLPTVERLRLPAAQVALSTRQLATLVRSGMPLDQALSAVAEQADDARAAKLFARGAHAGRLRRAAWRARFPAGRERSPSSIAASSRSPRRPAICRMSSTRLADYLEARQAQKQQFTLALVYPALVTDHRLRGDRRPPGLRRAADRRRLRAESPDAALAHAGA